MTFYYSCSNDETARNEEEEAGSILVALANQTGHQHNNNNIRSNRLMSIHNLLDGKKREREEEDCPNKRPFSRFMEPVRREHHYRSFDSPTYVSHHRSSISENQSDGYSAPSTPPPYSSYFHNKPQETHKLSIGSDMPLESNRVQSYFDPSDTKTGNVYSRVQDKRSTMVPKLNQKSTVSFSIKRTLHDAKPRPRYRRNALQAYISYMTYADMTRKKRQQQQQLVKSVPVQQASSSILQRYAYPTAPSSFYHPSIMQTKSSTKSNTIIEQPLTAFLHQPSSAFGNDHATKRY
ncbi:uncharacterized protein RHIMIDRAFT_283992 [Rhizopus microsporus ATCC 52813]|uniref:Uncharacterized protein n=2 Tax=Rhizopus microsporus TaxID=58291 RepID=A0A2G4STH2_RHIZD|nr:uncharacterized protein RHIMIDRAFT_283992 [Rhizopus microsporus ATCC 52813]PHZ12087.1 hypothetical protein RHIMIDRAFT_283992 [Rhizopus microsporus ATCC 52813]